MAYDRKDGFSYIDDVPLKIATAFLPPRHVVLPSISNPNEETFFEKFQYDFFLEKKVLDDIMKKEQESLENASKSQNPCNGEQSEPITDSSVKPSVQNILSLQSEILLPKPQKIFDKAPNTDEQNNSKINLSDFENATSSPFDYMELQTINDLEELSNVFQGLNNKYSSDNNVCKDKSSDSSSLNENNVSSNVSKSMSFPLQNNDAMFENSEKFLNSKETDVQGHNEWSVSPALAQANSFNPVPYTPKKFSSEITDESLSRTYTSVLSDVPCSQSMIARNSHAENGVPSMKSGLRGCKSYSDIHDLSEKCLKMSVRQGRPCTPPSTFSSEGINVPNSFSVQDNRISPDDNSATMSGLPDPYHELSEEGRKFVDAVADMGFLRDQVSRTVKHLGTDEKMVVEHLCQIQNLEESGYDCLEAEAALHLHDYNQEQAKQFLDLINKFQDLGFEKTAVKKALIQNKNDESKTIDALLS